MKNLKCYLLIFAMIFSISCSNEESDFFGSDSEYEADAEDLDANGLPKILFDVQLPTMPNSQEYIIDLSRWDIPNNGTDAGKTTDNLQAAIDWAHQENYSRVVLPTGKYLVGKDVNNIYQGGIKIHSNTEFIFSEGAVLEIDTNNKWNYCVISLDGDNIIIRGGTIKGDRDTHIFTPRDSDGKTAHDEGHGICVSNNNNVLIENVKIHALTGDGSLVLDSNDVTFVKNNIYNNRRQGISIVGGVRIEIKDNEIHHISGTTPQFGIDIEGPGRIDEDILIQNNYFHHNTGGDIVNATGENVYILDNVMEQGEGSKYVDGPIVSWHKTHNIIARNTITMVTGSVNGRLGYIQYSGGGDKGHNRATYVHENVCNSCGMYMYKSSDADVRRNKFLGYFMAFTEVENVILIDNLVTYSDDHPKLRFCWSYRFNDVTGSASGNYLGDTLEEIPLSKTTPHTLQCVLDGW
ncbi:parallel beta-helix repeat protein [Aquimarina sp. MAR_2010_214]|uniref:right-handed parallel beta-helix repeat-containing protein n=1 Tax=Aquimarina sp. MAR_2010_214 TaxID=1250026 RepID=UPI000C7141BF|nr:right-handed parallel beta-helix repeat-containing protein [Aquimarina sp. MAR_2010_214]PKV51403.1 parallel beta-helix repeat protein [Aquimarina sp. MAR_2010_214]